MEHSRTTVEFLYPFSNPCESWDEFLFLAKRRGSLAACHVPDSPGGSEERPAGATPQPFCSDVWYNAEGDPDSTFCKCLLVSLRWLSQSFSACELPGLLGSCCLILCKMRFL